MNNSIHFVNGKFVSENELLISPRDLGLTRGYAVADFLVTHNHKPFKIAEHVKRLIKSASLIGINNPWREEEIIGWVNETLNKNDRKTEKSIKIIMTGGKSHSMYQEEKPTMVIIIDTYSPPPVTYYENGVKAVAVKYERPFALAKTTHYIEGVMELAKIKNTGVTEIIYYDDLQVFEGAGCNVFAVIDGKLTTTKTNIVEGITRNVLIETIRLPEKIEVRDFALAELLNASEIFLTGSGKGIRGVVELNGKQVADAKVGPITKEVDRQYKNYINSLK